jgi:L-threonylcarbamoyladenylate synthase
VSTVDEVVAAVANGELVVVPTDTVYGLACRPDREGPVRALSALKGRSPDQPIALLAASLVDLVEVVPELAGRFVPHGPFTLVLPNPARRLPWLAGMRQDTIGVRLPQLEGDAAAALGCARVLAATSANLHGGVDPARVEDVPSTILEAVAATLDVGALPGAPSTVVDLTEAEPRVLREGAVPAAEALALIAEHAE